MIDERWRFGVVIGAVIATLLQILLAPNIAVLSAEPNFLATYCIIVTLLMPQAVSPVLPFVLGLLFDLMGGGPVGAMAFVLIIVTQLAGVIYRNVANDTVFVLLSVLFASLFIMEVLYSILLMACGLNVSFIDAFIYRALPCALYDCFVGVILYFIAARFLVGRWSQPERPRTLG